MARFSFANVCMHVFIYTDEWQRVVFLVAGNTNASLVFTVTVFNQYPLSPKMFYKVSSGMRADLYSKKSYGFSEDVLYFILLFQVDGYSFVIRSNPTTKTQF